MNSKSPPQKKISFYHEDVSKEDDDWDEVEGMVDRKGPVTQGGFHVVRVNTGEVQDILTVNLLIGQVVAAMADITDMLLIEIWDERHGGGETEDQPSDDPVKYGPVLRVLDPLHLMTRFTREGNISLLTRSLVPGGH